MNVINKSIMYVYFVLYRLLALTIILTVSPENGIIIASPFILIAITLIMIFIDTEMDLI